jgi:uncharacterized protein (TIGR03790 family)
VIRSLLFLLACSLAAIAQPQPKPPAPAEVVVVYNSMIPESEKLARIYAKARSIPEEQLVGLALSKDEEISRKEFDETLRKPLQDVFDRKQWWARGLDQRGKMAVRETKIHVLVTLRGVPSRIRTDHTPPPNPPPQPQAEKANEPPFAHTDEAAVDSELALMGIDGLPTDGPLNNPYFKAKKSFKDAGLPMLLVGRIDAARWETCERMIQDAIDTENTGLWGMCVLDESRKYPEGDQWIEAIGKMNSAAGIPCLVDRFPETIPAGFPLKDVAVYYGWYDWNISGPFQNPDFKFKRGAIGIHLHSFSAAQLRDPAKNWSVGLLERGAAATIGNVYEPYLQMTHQFDIMQRALLDGYTLVEAAYMAIPVLSWQNIVLGDPLYRPYANFDGGGEKREYDREYRALRLASIRWSGDPDRLENNLREAARRMQSPVIEEALGLRYAEMGMSSLAENELRIAQKLYDNDADRARTDLIMIKMERDAGHNTPAREQLEAMKARYPATAPVQSAIGAWLQIVSPPPAPPQNR